MYILGRDFLLKSIPKEKSLGCLTLEEEGKMLDISRLIG